MSVAWREASEAARREEREAREQARAQGGGATLPAHRRRALTVVQFGGGFGNCSESMLLLIRLLQLKPDVNAKV